MRIGCHAAMGSLALFLLVACGGEPSSGDTPTYYGDVKSVVDAKCASCHQTGGIAPFPLTTFEELRTVKDLVKSSVSSRTMPPWLAGEGCADYLDDRSLSDEQIALLVGWIDGGAPAGDAAASAGSVASPLRTLSRVDLTLGMSDAYTPQTDPDDYRCFLLDWPDTETRYVTGFRANPGNEQVVHHIIAYLLPPESAAEVAKLDEDDPGPGYTCFGGPGGGAGAQWLAAWAPGTHGVDFPSGTGIEVPPGSKIALQMHYNTANGRLPDRTTVDFKIESSVAKKSTVALWADLQWILGKGMSIPAGQSEVSHAYTADATKYSGDKPFLIYSAGLHMHTRGKSASLAIQHAGGARECMLEIPRWNFHWQNIYDFAKPKLFQPGDELAIECQWDNSAANQPIVDGQKALPKDLAWGEGTGDEMCLGIMYVSEP